MGAAAALTAVLGAAAAYAQTPPATPFTWPSVPQAPHGAPNVLVILTDDVGFGASSAFGGPIPTPTLERLASTGLRYNNFHTTGICSATRAALLTGRNHHNVGMAGVTDSPGAAPGYTTILQKDTATLAQVLRQNGYSTAMFGKSHLVPRWEQSGAGPFDRWPSGLGFDYFYGFLNGDTDQYTPQLFLGNAPVEPPKAVDYILDRDLADHALTWISRQKAGEPEKPFLIYYAPGTAHAPIQAPRDWIARFKGRFDQGWDKVREETLTRQKAMGIAPASAKLSPRPLMIPAWASLTPDQKAVYARMMEVYAGALSYADNQIGRIIDGLQASGELDNTLIIYIQGDNGSSAEGGRDGLWNELTVINGVDESFDFIKGKLDTFGGPLAKNHFPVGWAHAMSAPFPYFKRVPSHLGATSNDMVISWPGRIAGHGEMRSQFHHVIDVYPTVLEAVGLPQPVSVDGVAQKPLDGVSMAYTFEDSKAAGRRTTQYFELGGDRAIYADGWMASTTPTVMPWQLFTPRPNDPDQQSWELYDLKHDFSQSTNLAARQPKRLAELKALMETQSRTYGVVTKRPVPYELPPYAPKPRETYRYTSSVTRTPAENAPDLLNRSFEISARIKISHQGADGVLVTNGGRFGGYVLRLDKSAPTFSYNRLGLDQTTLRAPAPLPPGEHVVTSRFTYDGGGRGKGGDLNLSVDGAVVARGRLAATIPVRISLSETFDVGADTGTPVTDDYAVPSTFTGEIVEVQVQARP
jgi:arylsulfatase